MLFYVVGTIGTPSESDESEVECLAADVASAPRVRLLLNIPHGVRVRPGPLDVALCQHPQRRPQPVAVAVAKIVGPGSPSRPCPSYHEGAWSVTLHEFFRRETV